MSKKYYQKPSMAVIMFPVRQMITVQNQNHRPLRPTT